MHTMAAALLFSSLTVVGQEPSVQGPSDPATRERLLQPADLPTRATVAAELQARLADLRADAAEGGPRLLAALAHARELLPAGSAARGALELLLQRRAAPAELAPGVAELVSDLTFRPVAQAELPAGVPGYQALDELELRAYPAYRMVRARMRGDVTGAFWPLFEHIKSHDIAMTTPVQIDYEAVGEREREIAMAFLYGSKSLGQPGRDGPTEVVDVPATTVLTVGSRGFARPSRIAELRERLTEWLAHSAEWQPAGPMRVMEYNSPSIGPERRYFEVQVPVQPRVREGKRGGPV